MKNKKGFRRTEVLILELHEMDQEFQDLFYKREDRQHGLNRYWSEFDPDYGKDYGKSFAQEHLENYWKDQIKTNNYKGTLEEFIKEYGLEMDVWFINCGYDFTGVKMIIINC
jgi:hypothetical protein